MDSVKVRVIQEWMILYTPMELWSFLGVIHFYRQFITRYSRIATPLSNLLRKVEPWKWGAEQQESIKELKAKLVMELVLMLPSFTLSFEVHIDTYDHAIGGLLV